MCPPFLASHGYHRCVEQMKRDHDYVELLWLPVGVETNRFQQASLRLWEAFEAARARRRRCRLVHAGLRLCPGESGPFTLELMPAWQGGRGTPLATGSVGFRGADRFALFRYQLHCDDGGTFPDERWAIGEPLVVSRESGVPERILALAAKVPRYTWGRRVRGTSEMWTSDSVVSWLLTRAGIDLAQFGPPPGTRAPGWQAGLEIARRPRG